MNSFRFCVDRSLVLGASYEDSHGLRSRFHELGVLVDKLKTLIVAVTETWLVHNFDVTSELSGNNYLRSDRNRYRKIVGFLCTELII